MQADAVAVAPVMVPAGALPDLAAIYRQHFTYVWHALRRMGVNNADLEDLTQEVFVVVHRRLHTYDTTRPLKPWLLGILFRVASDWRRRAFQYRETRPGDVDATDGAASPEQNAADAQNRALIMRALDTLDFDRRAVLVMHEFHDHPIPDIAAALGIPVNTAYSRLRLARAHLSETLKKLTRPTEAP